MLWTMAFATKELVDRHVGHATARRRVWVMPDKARPDLLSRISLHRSPFELR